MVSDWRNLILEIEPRARLTAPATDAEIAAAEQAVGSVFPEDLKSLLRQTSGALDDYYGPIQPLSSKRSPFVDGQGRAVQNEFFPASRYSIIDSTLEHRSAELTQGNEWGEETVEMFSTFVVIGQDCGGNPFGFFAGATDGPCIRAIEHDSAELHEIAYTLEEYLRFFFEDAALFTN